MTDTERRHEATHVDAIVRPGWSRGRVFQLALPVPPSANTYYRTRAYIPADTETNKPAAATYISSAGKTYRQDVWACVASHSRDLAMAIPLTTRLAVDVVVHFATRRKSDIDNRLKPLLDALQHAGLMEDDSQVDVLRVTRGGVRPGGRCFVSVVELIPGEKQGDLELRA